MGRAVFPQQVNAQALQRCEVFFCLPGMISDSLKQGHRDLTAWPNAGSYLAWPSGHTASTAQVNDLEAYIPDLSCLLS